MVLLAVVALKQRTEHLLRGFAGREVRKHLGIIVLHELDPAGAAGCEHGKRRLVHLVGGDAADQLVGLLKDGKVRCHVHVEDFDVAEHSDRLDHLVLDMGSGSHVKAFSECSCDRRRRKEYDLLLGIRNRIPYIVDIALLIESADRTCYDTLAAADTSSCIEALVEGRTDTDVKSAADLADGADTLHVIAGGYAAQALDALIVVAYYVRRGIVDLILRLFILEVVFVNAVVIRKFLQFAVIAAHAGKTFLVVRGKDQLDRGLSGRADSRRVGQNFQTLFYRICAGSCESASSLDLNNAYTAGADAVDVLEIAKRRDLNVGRFCCLKDSCALRNSDRNIINL